MRQIKLQHIHVNSVPGAMHGPYSINASGSLTTKPVLLSMVSLQRNQGTKEELVKLRYDKLNDGFMKRLIRFRRYFNFDCRKCWEIESICICRELTNQLRNLFEDKEEAWSWTKQNEVAWCSFVLVAGSKEEPLLRKQHGLESLSVYATIEHIINEKVMNQKKR